MTHQRQPVPDVIRPDSRQAQLIDNLAAAVYTCDAQGRVMFYNRAAAELWGREPEIGKDLWCGSWRIYNPDGSPLPVEQCPMAVTLTEGRPVRGQEIVVERPDGSRRDVLPHPEPIRDSSGAIVGAINMLVDVTERKWARQTITESAERLRFIAESMPQKIFTAKANGDVDYFNPQWTEFTGLPFEQIRDWGWTQFVHPDDVEENVRVWRHSIATGEPFRFEHRFRRADGEYRWHLSRAVPFRDDTGRIVMWAGSNTDIHDVKASEQALRQSEARHRFLVELNAAIQPLSDPAQIMTVAARMLGEHLQVDRCAYAEIKTDEDQFIVTGDYARACASLAGQRSLSGFGSEVGSLLRAGQNHVVHDLRQDPRAAAALELYRQTQTEALVWVPLHKAGRLRAGVAVCQKTPRRWLQGEIELIELVGSRCWEAIEHARAVHSLQESEVRKSAVLNSSLDAIITMDHDGRIVEWNPAAEKIFGFRRAQAVGRAMDQTIIPRALRDRRRQGLASYLQTDDGPALDRRIERPALRSDGTEFPAELSITPVPDTDPPMFTVMVRDITERKHAEQALKDNDRRKDEFLATLAHELRNPLAPIRNSLGLLRMAGGSQPIHDMIERQVNQMVRLVNDLFEVARVSRGEIELRRERVELSTVVNSALETVQPLIEVARHRLTVTLLPEPLLLDADPVRLAQVFANLLNNACKYTPPNGQIWLTVLRGEDHVAVSVRDNGAGIPADMLPRVFDMFTQVDRDLNRAQGGLGIGLSLARTLVEMHGGRITARSDGPGKGSDFLVRLPLVEERRTTARETRAAPQAATPSETRKPQLPRVLVVDDNRDVADSLGMLLKFLGAEVHVAYSGAAALDALQTQRPTVILLDLSMPGMDGFEVARRVQRMPGPPVTLVALTGWGQEEDQRRTREAGFEHHLVKPPGIATLQALLASLEHTDRAAAPGP